MTLVAIACSGLAAAAMVFSHPRLLTAPIGLFGLFFGCGVAVRYAYLAMTETTGVLAFNGGDLDANSDHLLLAAVQLAFAGLCVVAGYHATRQSRLIWRAAEGMASLWRMQALSGGYALALWWVVPLSGAGFFMLAADSYSSIQDFVVGLQGRTIAVLEGKGYIGTFIDLGIVCALIVLASRRSLRIPGPMREIVAAVPACVVIVVLALLGGRGALLQFLLAAIILAQGPAPTANRQWGATLGVTLIGLCVIVGGLAARQALQHERSLVDALGETTGEILGTTTASMPLVDSFALAKSYTEVHGHDLGLQYFDYMTRVVPRPLWEDKPELLGVKIRWEFWGDRLGGIPATYFGELYFAWGVVGLLVGALAFGVALRWLEALRLCWKRDRLGISPAYVIVLSFLPFTVIRSGLEMGFMKLVIYTAILFILARFSGPALPQEVERVRLRPTTRNPSESL